MKIVIPAQKPDLDAPVSTVFGRSRFFLFIDTETGRMESKSNPATNSASGAGTEAAQFLVKSGAQTVLSKKVGPNAQRVLIQAGIAIGTLNGNTARQVLERFKVNEH